MVIFRELIMEIVKVINKKNEYKRIKALYLEAFPPEERAPFHMMKSRAKRKKADCWNFIEDGKWIGFAYVISYENLAYLFYFAIDEKLRGNGYGSTAIKAIADKYQDKKFFLALENWREEADNSTQRIKRHEFYKKNGMKDLPYKLKEAGVVYVLMGNGDKIEPEEYRLLIDNWLGFPLKLIRDMEILKE